MLICTHTFAKTDPPHHQSPPQTPLPPPHTFVMNPSMGSTATLVRAMMTASQTAFSCFSSSFLLSTCRGGEGGRLRVREVWGSREVEGVKGGAFSCFLS